MGSLHQALPGKPGLFIGWRRLVDETHLRRYGYNKYRHIL